MLHKNKACLSAAVAHGGAIVAANAVGHAAVDGCASFHRHASFVVRVVDLGLVRLKRQQQGGLVKNF